MKLYNIYVDESCHLENDHFPVMVIGYIKLEKDKYEYYKNEIKAIKIKHKSPTEIKWQKLSLSREKLYKELIDFFFNNALEFRCVLIKNKENLDHERFNRGDHNSFYYKIVYYLLHSSTNPINNDYQVFLDIKDTRGKERLRKIEEVLNNSYRGNSPFRKFQHIRSEENEFIQLSDLFIGAIGYKSRGEYKKKGSSHIKNLIIDYLENLSGYRLDEGTEPAEDKFNIFDFQIRVTR